MPAGTKIPVILMSSLSSQTNEAGEVFLGKANCNLVTREKYLLIAQGGQVNGEITSVKVGRLFVRNGNLMLDTKNINTTRGQCAPFIGNIDIKIQHNWFVRIMRAIFKGSKTNLQEGKVVTITLTQPVRIDLTNGWILE